MVDTQIRKEEIAPQIPPVASFDIRPPSEIPKPEYIQPQEVRIPQQETHSTPEQQPIESHTEEGFLDEAIDGLRSKLRRPKKQKNTTIPQVRDEVTVKVEKIMEEGMADAFKELNTIERQEFKIRGEQTALQIRELLKATHVKIKKIFRLLFEWLKMLPGINRFYLEQEAKIKADKIISLQDQYKK
ncbi:MAG: hypothetical protein CO029_02430 [Candidatus Magasanikbacteria bacterium CG_4_9_14_0_2_um_filter_41_10]|uniref:Uncharacterized protein n=1 Tax=Candidatus Magasanikbacteria bacterium CG_4_10_14_0_2_um_filter_41_31 TaxID=1974639 RepID=A0A2M7V1S0_9BACT|nr:MAG: hypothetical protein AUJ37_03025 [Candidatus Magasanikbacteria bacterium CG1_02_41_34]PIZ92300.1 MAG: hypothetical protein COX83_04570 [Candidatus Magasanikbacteria bacterium CG_4_10_14_0_2_um_filter_41_31]PJC53502.1 MAG: hypothetical protein CO029_02430 [Candidatus Magasanikbacteria bacterium CG_4_9_14_0_2_um_filter_41_10]